MESSSVFVTVRRKLWSIAEKSSRDMNSERILKWSGVSLKLFISVTFPIMLRGVVRNPENLPVA
jgi:hypothetical protein